MSDDFVFSVGEWETNDGNIAVVVHKLTDPFASHPLIGYVEDSEGRQYHYTWRLDGSWINDPSHDRSLKRPAPKPREWWLNIYPTTQYAHKTRDAASVKAIPNLLIACVHDREVLEDDGSDA